MPTKKNFLGAEQNYNPKNGEYESSLVGKNGQVVKDADGDGKVNEGKKKTTHTWKSGKQTEIEYLDKAPEGYKEVEGALTAPNGYRWYSNGKSYFDKDRDTVLVKDQEQKVNVPSYIEDADKVALVPDLVDKGYTSEEAHNILFEARDELDKQGKEVNYNSLKEYINSKYGEQDFNEPGELERQREEKDFNAPKEHDYSEIFDGDYQRSWGVPDFKDEDDIKTLNDIVEKAMEYDGDDGAIDISNNAMERIGELAKFTEEEQDKLASGTGEEIMDILRSKEKKELTFEGAIKNADDDVLDEEFGKDTPERKLVGSIKEDKPQTPSLRDRRKEWRNNLSKSGDEYNQGTQELYRKLKSGEISRKEYNQGMKALQEKYIKSNTKPQRDRLAVDDELEGYDKQFKAIREELAPLEDEDSIAFNRHLMFNEPYDESKKNPRIAELNKQLKDVKDKRTDARRRLAREIGSQFGRKDYRKEIDSGNLPSGNDRVYAMYQKSLEEPYLDFGRMIANDVYDNVEQYPSKLEFEDDLFEISKSGGAYDHYKKENGKWVHVSTGTIAGLGDNLGEKLEEENLK